MFAEDGLVGEGAVEDFSLPQVSKMVVLERLLEARGQPDDQALGQYVVRTLKIGRLGEEVRVRSVVVSQRQNDWSPSMVREAGLGKCFSGVSIP